jgi:Nucleotidyl transferase AbiEii toxin, Type IV TA system
VTAVSPQILDLIAELQSLECIAQFSLAGGTNLAIRYNHRISEDIDLFTADVVGIDGLNLIRNELSKRYKENLKFCELINEESGNQYCFLRALIVKKDTSIKVEFIQNIYQVDALDTIDGLRLLSVKDIGVLKLFSAAGRKANKDIYDLDLITDEIPLAELWNFMLAKKQKTQTSDRKNLFDLDGDSGLADNISLLLDFDNIDYANLPMRPSHSNDRLVLLPSSKKWQLAKSSWERKVRELMRGLGIVPPPIRPIN